MRTLNLSLILILVIFSLPLKAGETQETEEPQAIDEFVGEWLSGDDSHLGPSNATLHVSRQLGGAMLRLEYGLSTIDGDKATRVLGGIAYYQLVDGLPVKGFWADTVGNLLTVSPKFSEGRFVADWGHGEFPQGTTTYELQSDGSMVVTDYVLRGGDLSEFNRMRFGRSKFEEEESVLQTHVLGIGGLFFRGEEPAQLSEWYDRNFAISPPPQSYDQLPWRQEEGFTVFAPFERGSDYFGDQSRQWMVNFRVRDLDGLIEKLRQSGETVSDPVEYPNGRFARMKDPEGNPIELWEPSE